MFSRRRLFWLSPLLVLSAVTVVLLAQAENRKGTKYAFLVACSGYDTTELKPLPYTIKEMKEFYDILLATGYDKVNVKLLHDEQKDRRLLPEKAKILAELELLLGRIEPEDSLLVAFNGHGVQFQGDKSGYFCPIDASVKDRKTLLPTEGKDSEGKDGLFERLKKCPAKRKLLLVNACRKEPLSSRNQAPQVELEDRDDDEIPEGIAALYSCKAKQESYYYDPTDERTKGRERSLFFHHVIEVWKGSHGKSDDLLVEDFFREVRKGTAADADNIIHKPQTPIVRRQYKGKGEWIVRDRIDPRSEDSGEARRDSPRPVPPPLRRDEPERAVAPFNKAKAKALQEAWAEYLGRKVEEKVDLGGGVKMEFVLIPPGKFLMGSPEDEKDRSKDEEQHEVEITRAFYLGKYEVTQEQYKQIVGKNPSYFSADGAGKENVKDLGTRRFPVEEVSWDDAAAFCRKLTDRDEKRRFRLPSEAEWEYACRAGTTPPFHFGKVLNGDKANCDGNYPYGTDEKGTYLGRTCRVGSYASNAFGLHHMHGNVWEWCQYYYGPYNGLEEKDPLRTVKVDKNARVLRGGSWCGFARICRAAFRSRIAPGNRDYHNGFRVAFRLD